MSDQLNATVEARDYELEARELGEDFLNDYFHLRREGYKAEDALSYAKLLKASKPAHAE